MENPDPASRQRSHHTQQNWYDTDSQTGRDPLVAEQRAIDRLKCRAADQPAIPTVAATKDTSLDQFTEIKTEAKVVTGDGGAAILGFIVV